MNLNGDLFVAMSDNLLRNSQQGYAPSHSRDSPFHGSREAKHAALYQPGLQNLNSPSLSQQSSSSSSSSINTLPTNAQNISTLTSSAANSASLFMKRSMSMFHNSSQPSSTPVQSGSQGTGLGQHSLSSQNHHSSPAIHSSPSPQPTAEMYTSALLFFKNDNSCSSLSHDWLVRSAHRYELAGQSVGELCEHNAEVADKLNRTHVGLTWRMLKQLCAAQPTALHHNSLQSASALPSVNSGSSLPNRDSGWIGDRMISEEKASEELKNRHQSGQSRHPSGSAVLSGAAGIAQNPSVSSAPAASAAQTNGALATTASGSAATSDPTTPAAISTVGGARTANLSGGNRRSGNSSGGTSGPQRQHSGQTGGVSVPRLTSGTDSEDEIGDLLPTPTEKEFNREHQDFFFGDGDVSQSVANLTSYDIANADNLTQLDGELGYPNSLQISFDQEI